MNRLISRWKYRLLTGRRALAVGLIALVAISAQAADPAAGGASATPPSPLSPEQAIQYALEHNRSLAAERQSLKIAHGVVLETRALLWPQLKLDGNYARFNADVVHGDTMGLPIPKYLWSGGIRLSQSIYEGGRVGSSRRSSKLVREKAAFQYEKSLSEILLTVRITYDEVLYAMAQAHFLQDFLEFQKLEVSTTRDKVSAGGVSKLELMQAEVELSRLDARLITARNQLHLARIRLLDALGADSSDPLADGLTLSGRLNLDPPSVELSTAVQQALANRADLKALDRSVLLSAEDVVKARSTYKPSVQLNGGYAGMADALGRDVAGWFVGAQASWTLFDGMSSRGKVEQARAAHEKTVITLDDYRRRVEIDVRTAHSGLVEAQERHGALLKAVAQADEALRQTREQAGVGNAAPNEVKRAERSKQEVEISLLEALYAYNVAMAKFDYAIGMTALPETNRKPSN